MRERVLQLHPQLSPEDEQCFGCHAVIPAGDEHGLFTLDLSSRPEVHHHRVCPTCRDNFRETLANRGEPLDQRD